MWRRATTVVGKRSESDEVGRAGTCRRIDTRLATGRKFARFPSAIILVVFRFEITVVVIVE